MSGALIASACAPTRQRHHRHASPPLVTRSLPTDPVRLAALSATTKRRIIRCGARSELQSGVGEWDVDMRLGGKCVEEEPTTKGLSTLLGFRITSDRFCC